MILTSLTKNKFKFIDYTILFIKLDYITKKTHTIDITIYFIINDINILKIFKSIIFIQLMLTFCFNNKSHRSLN